MSRFDQDRYDAIMKQIEADDLEYNQRVARREKIDRASVRFALGVAAIVSVIIFIVLI